MTSSKRRGYSNTNRSQLDGGLGQKRVDSDRISEHVAAFEREGGHIEKLGTTIVLRKIDEKVTPQVTPEPAKRRR
jgi:hypothetical protein